MIEKLKEYEDKETSKVVKQTLRGLGLTGEKINIVLNKHKEDIINPVLKYLNTNNKE